MCLVLPRREWWGEESRGPDVAAAQGGPWSGLVSVASYVVGLCLLLVGCGREALVPELAPARGGTAPPEPIDVGQDNRTGDVCADEPGCAAAEVPLMGRILCPQPHEDVPDATREPR